MKNPACTAGFFIALWKLVRIWEELAKASDGSSRLRSRMRDCWQSLAFGMANRARDKLCETQHSFSDATTVQALPNLASALVSALKEPALLRTQVPRRERHTIIQLH
jgi:hypothetical protein